jgi:hypothetical protein
MRARSPNGADSESRNEFLGREAVPPEWVETVRGDAEGSRVAGRCV